jgi:hypothetical protein
LFASIAARRWVERTHREGATVARGGAPGAGRNFRPCASGAACTRAIGAPWPHPRRRLPGAAMSRSPERCQRLMAQGLGLPSCTREHRRSKHPRGYRRRALASTTTRAPRWTCLGGPVVERTSRWALSRSRGTPVAWLPTTATAPRPSTCSWWSRSDGLDGASAAPPKVQP